MARIRTVKPEFWSSEQVMECSRDARLLFIGIWNFADDYGNHPASPKTIKALVLPGDEVDSSTVQGWLDELSANGLLAYYDHSGKRYLHICGWKHQKIEKPTRKHPAYAEAEKKDEEEADPDEEGDSLPSAPDSTGPQKSAKPKAAKFDPLTARPANVSEQAWSDWCQHRREIRKPLTAKTCEQQAKALEGHPSPDAVLRQSISNGWTGIFPEKVQTASNVTPISRHHGFADRDYTTGLKDNGDGTYGF